MIGQLHLSLFGKSNNSPLNNPPQLQGDLKDSPFPFLSLHIHTILFTMSCKHISWLEVFKDHSGVLLENTNRLERVAQHLPNPDVQTPRLVHLIGTQSKNKALKHLFPQNNFSRQYNRGIVNLRVDGSSSDSSAPLLIVDSNPFSGFTVKKPEERCHLSSTYSICWPLGDRGIWDVLYSRLLFPFSDLVCLFAEDFASLDSVSLRILSWMNIESSFDVLKPGLIIVVNEGSPLGSLQDEDFRLALLTRGERPTQTFGMIKVFRLAGDYLSPLARYQRLRDEMYQHTYDMLLNREHKGHKFSVNHFAAFFEKAIMHTATTITQMFDFIEVSQLGKSGTISSSHLKTLLKLASKFKTPVQEIASYIASCTLVDSFHPLLNAPKPNPRLVKLT